MNRIKKLFFIVSLTLLLSGCSNNSNNDEIYKIESSVEETSTEKTSIENILRNNPSTIEVSKEYSGIDLTNLFLKDYSKDKNIDLSEIINKDKKTFILITSPYCPSCEDINYTDILTLEETANVIIATFESYEDSEKFNEMGIYNSIYIIDNEKLVSAYNDNKEEIQANYNAIISSMKLPSCLFVNSDGTFAFCVNGTKTAGELREYLDFLH